MINPNNRTVWVIMNSRGQFFYRHVKTGRSRMVDTFRKATIFPNLTAVSLSVPYQRRKQNDDTLHSVCCKVTLGEWA